jgi:hypothetical protein
MSRRLSLGSAGHTRARARPFGLGTNEFAAVVGGLYASIASLGVLLAVFVVASHHWLTALVVLLGIGLAGTAIAPASQTRLMNVAGDTKPLRQRSTIPR